MSWYKKILKEKKKEIITSAAFAVVFALAISLWHYFTGKSFEWQSISPVEAPGLLPRLFYSALVYVSLGAILYAAGFYKFLYSLYRGTRGGWRAYNDMKGLIWWVLILGMYFVIIPVVVDLLNAVISFGYNIFNLILYVFPPLGISLIVFGIGYIIYKKYYAIPKSR
jgi:hypothetical protein